MTIFYLQGVTAAPACHIPCCWQQTLTLHWDVSPAGISCLFTLLRGASALGLKPGRCLFQPRTGTDPSTQMMFLKRQLKGCLSSTELRAGICLVLKASVCRDKHGDLNWPASRCLCVNPKDTKFGFHTEIWACDTKGNKPSTCGFCSDEKNMKENIEVTHQ